MRYFILIFFTLLQYSLSAQENIALPDTVLPATRGYERNPLSLASRLTANKKTDKEKFDMIFTWVAKNIRYDYYSYLAPSGASAPNIKRILKYKTGICLDYAFLMDTLCKLAGLRNVTVYGYAKDDLFDLNDSTYMDNHAWNAIKLDNYWYVYDVTWAAGTYEWKYTKFSQLLVNWQRRLLAKKRVKTIHFKAFQRSECDTTQTGFKQTYITLPLTNRILLRILSLIEPKKHLVFNKKMNPDFYLSNPDVFSITHYPDNPYWALNNKYPTIRGFETDSAYYYLTDSIYKTQKRISEFCTQCDDYFTLSEMSRQKQMKTNSIAFNNRNRFMPSMCDYTISDLFYKKSLPETDSIIKIPLIDSALAYINGMKDELRKCAINVSKDNEQLRNKNTLKAQLLYGENREYLRFLRSLMATTTKASNKTKRFIQKTRVTEKALRAYKKKIAKIAGHSDDKPEKYKLKVNLIALQSKYTKNLRCLDSFNLVISQQRSTYTNLLTTLSDNLWHKTLLQDTLAAPFLYGAYYRWLYLLDNYKKPVVDLRRRIPKYQMLYAGNLHDSIYNLSDSSADIGMYIFSLFEQRNALIIETENLLNVLANQKLASADSLADFIKINSDLMQENICWLTGGSSRIKSVIKGYKRMLKNQKNLEEIIRFENREEYSRYRYINHELTARKIKFRSIPSNNMRVASVKRSLILHYKREYLKSLREARKKAKKENARSKKT